MQPESCAMGQPGDPQTAQPAGAALQGYPPPAPGYQYAGPQQAQPYAAADGGFPPQQPYPPGARPPPPGYPAQQVYQPYPAQQAYQPYPPTSGYRPQQAGYGAPKPPGFDAYDVEAQQAGAAAATFAEQRVRNGFIRKVVCIVFLQLAITAGVACCFMFIEPLKNYVRPGGSGEWLFIVVWILSLVVLIGLTCSTTLRRKHPYNILALTVFTLLMASCVGVICSYWDVAVVLEALAVTCAAVLGLTLAAIFGKFDLTSKGHVLAMASMVVFFVAIVTIIVGIFWFNKWWYLTISVIFALLFSAYLVYDIQMVMGGKTHAISPDEYVFASLQIYLDIVQLFLMLLSIMGIARS